MSLFGRRKNTGYVPNVLVEDLRLLREKVRVLEGLNAAKDAMLVSKEGLLDSQRTLLNDQRNIIITQKETNDILLRRAEEAERQLQEARAKNAATLS